MSTEILFFGTGDMPRRNLNRTLDTLLEGPEFEADATFTALFYADADWNGTTDLAFDYVLEHDRFSAPVVLVPTEDVADEKLVEDLVADGAVVERYDDIYEGVMTRSDFTHAVCFFDEDNEDLADDVMTLVEDGRTVFDATGGMVKFDIEIEEVDGDDVADSPESVDSPESEDSAEEAPEGMSDGAKAAMDFLTEVLVEANGAEIDLKALADEIDREDLEDLAAHLGIEVKKGMWSKTIIDEALDIIDESLAASAPVDEQVEEESVESPESVDSPESEDSPEEAEVMPKQDDEPLYDDLDRVAPTNEVPTLALDARPAMVHVEFASIVDLLALYDGDADAALEAAAAFGVTFEDAR